MNNSEKRSASAPLLHSLKLILALFFPSYLKAALIVRAVNKLNTLWGNAPFFLN